MKNFLRFKNVEEIPGSGAGAAWIMWVIAGGAFADASVVPFPIATLFVAAVLFNPAKSKRFIIAGLIGTVSGAVAGYFIGRYAWFKPDGSLTGLAQFAFDHIKGFSEHSYQQAGHLYGKWRFPILFLGAFSPIPYGVFAISSGIFNQNFLPFFITTICSHIVKYSFLSFITVRIGTRVYKYIKISKKAGIAVFLAIILIAVLLIVVSCRSNP